MDALIDFKDTDETGEIIFDKNVKRDGQACTEPIPIDSQSYNK